MLFVTTTNGSRLVYPGVFTPVRAGGYVSPPRVLEPETTAHLNRVSAAGGVYTNTNAIDDAYKFIKSRNLTSGSAVLPNLQICLDARFGVLLDATSGRVNKLFSVLGAASDAGLVTATAGVPGPEYLAAGILGLPSLLFNNSGLVTAAIPCMQTGEFGHCALMQMPVPVQNGATAYSHPTGGVINMLANVDGFLRQVLVIGGAGYNANVASDGGNGYVGVPARTIARYKHTRAPFQLLASGNGEFTTVYSTSATLAATNYTAAVALGYQANFGNGDVFRLALNTRLSTLWIMDREDSVTLADLDAFIQQQYGM